KETQSSLAKDKSPSHPSPSTPVVAEMHKEAHQAAGGPTSLGATSKERAHPQLFQAEADPGIYAPNDFIPEQQGMDEGTQNYSLDHIFAGTNPSVLLEDLSNLMYDTRSDFLTPDSPRDEPIIVSDKSEKEETEIYEDTYATSHDVPEDTSIPHPPFPKSVQIKELMAQPKELPSKITELFGDVKELKKFATILENASSKAIDEGVPLAGHASASPAEGEKNTNQATKDADNENLNQQPATTTPPTTSFQSPLFPKSKGKEVMSSKDAEDEETESNFEDDHANPAKTMSKSSNQKKLKNFIFVTEGGEQIHLTVEKIEEPKRIEESLKAELAKQEVEKVKSELDLMDLDVVIQYYNKNLMYDKYYDKVLKRRKSSKITNGNVLTTKGPITLKVYKEDRINEVISNLKVGDLHLAEWREVVQACLNKKEKGWKTIYGLIKTRMEYLDQTKKELKIDFNRPLKEQDPLSELNDLANKKRKRVDDLKDHSMSIKKHKSSTQHEKEVH
ncbi:hypothetical protein Tco_1435262, partial [Tanacetum coccineum]